MKIDGRVTDTIFEGERQMYIVEVAALSNATFRVYHHDPDSFELFSMGDAVALGWNRRDLKIFSTAAELHQ